MVYAYLDLSGSPKQNCRNLIDIPGSFHQVLGLFPERNLAGHLQKILEQRAITLNDETDFFRLQLTLYTNSTVLVLNNFAVLATYSLILASRLI